MKRRRTRRYVWRPLCNYIEPSAFEHQHCQWWDGDEHWSVVLGKDGVFYTTWTSDAEEIPF